MRNKTATLLGAFALLAGAAQAQLTVSPQTDLQELARAITGPGVQIANPVIICHQQGYGDFNFNGSVLGGVNEGILLTTGTIDNAVGPNNVENRTFEQGTPGSALLNTVMGRTTFDACHFEFDVIPGGDTLRFNFTFASEEYNEWVGSQYNDVFGFFISGPGIVGDPGIGAEKNIALIPNSNQAVTINNVNNGSNQAFYFDNAGGPQIQYDGITQGLQAVAGVQPCQTYRLKLIVADASDRKFDSGVFIERIQSNAVTMDSFTASAFPNIVEGCNAGTVRITRQVVTNDPLEVPFFLGGTATNGVDYPLIGDADPTVVKIAVIPAGQASVDILFDAYADGIPEGIENIRVYLGNSICPGSYLDSLDLFIQDSLFTDISAPTTICPGGYTPLAASGGVDYAWSPSAGLSNAAIADPTASPASTTTYTVAITAGDCVSNLSTTVTVGSMALSANVLSPLCQGQGNGAVNLSINGGTPPYAFEWTGPNGFSANTEDLVNVGSGTYTVTVTDATGCTRVQSFNVNGPAALSLNTAPSILPFGQNISCNGGQDGMIDLTVSGGTAPYTYAWTGPNGFTATTQDLPAVGAGAYQVTVTDANGCTATANRSLTQPPALLASMTSVTHVACFGSNDGSATANVNGGIPPYSFAWNTTPAPTGATATGLAPGTHTVTVTDGYGCTSQATVTINGPAAAMTVTLTNVSNVFQCQGQQNPHGSATAVVSGGTAPYTYHWNTNPVQNTAIGNFSAGGTYTVTVTDANGCTASTQVTVQQPGSPSIAVVAQSDVLCGGDNNGSATVALSGGSAIQSISWNTIPPQTGATATNLPPGTWTATAQHADGCQTIASVTINGPSSALSASIQATSNVNCSGDGNGSATAQATGGTPPYSYAWNTSPVQTSATATALPPGSWTVTVTDANGCSAQSTATVTGPSTPLSVAIIGFTNVLCFETAQGTAQSLASGGTQPYSYSWNSAPVQTGPNATDLPQGTWTVTVTDANGCTASTSVNIGGPQFGVYVYFEDVSPVSCYGANDGFATAVATGGSNSYTIIWNTTPPQYGFTATGLAPGLYTVEVQDNNGCDIPKFHDVVIEGPDAPLAVNITATNPTCSYTENGTLAVTISGGAPPYNNLWSDAFGNSAGVQSLNGLAAGTYDLHVWDSNGCTLDTTITLVAPAPISIQGVITTASCQGTPNGSITTTQTGAVQPFSISWTGPNGYQANTFAIGGLAAGVYTMYIVDANGCAGMQAFDVSEPGVFTVNATISTFNGGWNVSCAGATDGTIDLEVTGGTGDYTHAWTGPDGFTSTDQDISGLQAGTYHLTVTDENGCSVLSSHTLTAPTQVTVNLASPSSGGHHITCNGASNGSINSSINGGTAPYGTSWNGPNGFTSNDANITGLGPGTYTMTVTDANGCVRTATRTLTEPAPLNSSAITSTTPSGDAIACNGASTGSIDLTVVGGVLPYNVQWTGPNGFSSSTQDLFNLPAGSYTVNITDANGCTTGLTVELTEPDPMDLDITLSTYNGQDLSCAGAADASITMGISGGAGGFTFAWSGPNGFTSTDQDLNAIGAGTYTVIVTDANGCTTSQAVNIQAPEPIAVDPVLADHNGEGVSCFGATDGSIDLGITGGTAPYDIAWQGPDGFTASSASLSDLGAGTYTATITDANGCVMETDLTITSPELLDLDLDALTYAGGANVSCSGTADGAVDLTINGGNAPFSINWTDGLGFNASTEDISDVGAGVYQVTVTDANGCNANAFITLDSPMPLAVDAIISNNNGNNISCAGGQNGSIDITVSGGTQPYTYAWDNGSTDPLLNGAGAGTHSVTVTDANGCTVTTSYGLSAPEPIDTDLSAATQPGGFSVSCTDATDGSITTTIIGGTTPYDTQWSGPNGFTANTASISGLAAGTYVLELTDANGCNETHTVTLTAPAPVSILLNANTWNGEYHITCSGESNGQAGATVTGGLPGYDHLWTGPNGFNSTGATISNVPAGSYTLSATDANGCTATATLELTEPDPMDVQADLSDVGAGYQVSCSGNDGAIDVQISGGTEQYNYSWTGPNGFGSTDQDLSGLGEGSYHLVVTDANGCIFETNFELEAPDAINVTFDHTPNTCPGDGTGAIAANMTGGAAPFDFAWTGPGGNTWTEATITDLEAGGYTLTVSDVLGCEDTYSTQLQGPAPLQSGTYVSFYGQFNLQCVGDSTGVIDLTPNGGTAPYDVVVNGPAGFNSTGTSLTGLIAGSYDVSIVDANGCAMDTTITLIQPELEISTSLDVSLFPSGTNISCFGAYDGWINATVTGGVGPYTFFWRGPDSLEFNTPNINGLPAGEYAYELVVTDANECSFFTEVILTQPDSVLGALIVVSEYEDGYNVTCSNAANGTITVNATGGNGGYQHAWTGPNGYSSTGTELSDLLPGTYTVMITDMNGCEHEESVTLVAPDPLAIDLEVPNFPGGTAISCHGANDASINANISGGTPGYSLSWSGPNGFSSTDLQIEDLGPGTYCLTVTDANGCVLESCTTIAEPQVLSATTNIQDADCGQSIGSVQVSVTGGTQPYDINWNSGQNGAVISGLDPGAFTAVVTDANGCSTTVQAVVSGTPAVSAQGVATGNTCHGGEEGTIELDVTEGTAPFSFQWSNGTTTEDLDGLAAGDYTVTVSDANGCTFTDTWTVEQNDSIYIGTTLSAHTGGYHISTWQGSNGSITTTVSGGTGPYTYLWNTGSTASWLNNLPAGLYTLQVTDANGCTADLVVVLTQPDDLEMPTGFSPNGDGANDHFIVRGLDAHPANTFVVVNRWGNVVYDRLNYRNDWNGENAQGQPLPDGTYFAILKVDNGERTLQGYVDLRR